MATTPITDIPMHADNTDGVPIANAAYDRIEVIAVGVAADRDLTAPPGGPSDGDVYIVGGSATGDWAGKDDNIAYLEGGVWKFIAPVSGMAFYLVDEAATVRWSGAAWV